jgi:aflatoxin B1 aldehyde reductase
MDAQYRAGHFKYLGLCNLSVEMVSEWLEVAAEKGYVKPAFYQGQYNLFCRVYEASLFPLLRSHNIGFIAFSPLAGGFLTGKLTFSKGAEDLIGTRFEVADGNYMGMGFRHWYDKDSMHTAMRRLSTACQAFGIVAKDAALRWLMYHAVLAEENGDGFIVGPSTLEQLEEYKRAADQGALPKDLVEELNGLWEGIQDDAALIVAY